MKNIKIKILFLAIYLLLRIALIHPESTDDRTITDNSTDINDDDYINFGKEDKGLTIIEVEDKTQDIKSISKTDIDKLNPPDLSSLLQNAFNLSINSNGAYGNQTSVNIRGFGSGRVLILIDGIPMNSSQSDGFDLSMIPISDIEEIQIIKGGSDTKYNLSGAIGGVINIITKKKTENNYRIYSGIYNMFYYPDFYYLDYHNKNKSFSKPYDFVDTQKFNFGFGIGNKTVYYDIKSEFNKAWNHFIYKDDNNFKKRLTDNEVYDASVLTSLNINLPLYMTLILSGNYFYGNKNIPGPMNSDNKGKQIDHLANTSIFFDADYIGTDRIDTELKLNYKFHSLNWMDTTTYSLHNLSTVTAINKWGFIVTSWFNLTIGGDIDYNYLNSTNLRIIQTINGGGYLTGEFSILNKVKIIPSIKLIYNKNYPIPIPKIGFVFFIGDYFVLKSNFYRTYKVPAINDLYWPKDSFAEGNPDLKNEDGIGGDIILCYSKPKYLSAETSVYVNYLQDAILWQTTSGGRWKPLNVGKAFYFGIDTNAKSDFSEYVMLDASYSFLLTYALDKDLTFDSNKRMPYVPMHKFGFGITFSWKTGSLNFTGHFESERYTTTYNLTELKSFFTFDINFSQKIKIITLFASVKNAFNYSYYLAESYPMPGGSIIFGIKIDYEGKFKKKSDLKK